MTPRQTLRAALVAATITASCRLTLDRSVGPGEIRGAVVVALADDTTEGATGAVARLEGANLVARSSARGQFVIRGVPEGRYKLRLRHDRRLASGELVTSALTLRADVKADGAIDLGKLTVRGLGALKGAVTDGAVAAQATVVIDGEGLATTDPAGIYRINRLEPGGRLVSVLRDVGRGAALFDGPNVTIASRVETTRDLQVNTLTQAPAATITVRARMLGKTDHSGIRVTARGATGDVDLPLTGADGIITKASLTPGVYAIVASADGFLASRIPLVVARGDVELPDMLLVPATCTTDRTNPICASFANEDTDGDGVADYADECPDDTTNSCAIPTAPRWAAMPKIANTVAGFTLRGEATPGATISIYKIDSGEALTDAQCSRAAVATITVPSAPVLANGLVAFAIDLPAGAITPNAANGFRAQAELEGQLSACSAPFEVLDDRIPPGKPLDPEILPRSPSNTELSPTLTIRALDAATVTIFREAGCAGTAVADVAVSGTGNASYRATVPPNTATTFSVRSKDAAGNASECSSDATYVHDDEAPKVPLDLEVNPIVVDGAVPGRSQAVGIAFPSFATRDWTKFDLLLVRRATPTVPIDAICSDSASFAEDPRIGIDAAELGLAYDLPQRNGETLALCLRLTDLATNRSGWNLLWSGTIDAVAPPPPDFAEAAPRTRDRFGAIRIRAEAKADVRVFRAPDCSGTPESTVKADVRGVAAFVPQFELVANDGTTFVASAVDGVGNASGCSAPFVVKHDDIPPVFPGADVDPIGDGQAVSPSLARVHVQLRGEPGVDWSSWDSVVVVASGTTAADCEAGHWVGQADKATLAPVDLAVAGISAGDNGATLIVCARVQDDVGNAGEWVVVASVSVDAIAPVSPSFFGPARSNVKRPTFRFAAQTHSRVEVWKDAGGCSGTMIGTGLTDDAPLALVTPTVDLDTQAPVNLFAHVVDGAGNVSGCTPFTWTYDATPPDIANLKVNLLSTWLANLDGISWSGNSSPTGRPFEWEVVRTGGEPIPELEFAWRAGMIGDDCATGTPVPTLSAPRATIAPKYSISFQNLPDGLARLCVQGFDEAGNPTGWGPLSSLGIDGTPPVVALEAPVFPVPGGQAVMVPWSGLDAGAGLSPTEAAYEFTACPLTGTCDGTRNAVGDSSFTSNPVAFNDCDPVKVAVRGIDRLGNASAWQERIIRPAPDTPRNITVRPTLGELELAWDAAEGAYRYEVCSDASGNPCTISVLPNFRWSNPPAGTANIVVRANGLIRNDCWGPQSAATAANPPAFSVGTPLVGATAGDGLGAAIALLGDVMGLGRDQFLVGVPGLNGNAGSVQGATLDAAGNILLLPALRIDGGAAGDRFGEAIAALGDVNGDDVPDFAVGAPGASKASPPIANAGAVFVYSGRTLKELWRTYGPSTGSAFGAVLSGGGDVNGDGFGDVIVGAPKTTPATPINTTQAFPPTCASVQAEAGWYGSFSGANGVLMTSNTWCYAGHHYGAAVAIVRDLNADGYDDLVIGGDTNGVDVDGTGTTGPVNFGRLELRSMRTLDGTNVFVAAGGAGASFGVVGSVTAGSRLGLFVRALGDLNGDGRAEIGLAWPGLASGADLQILDTSGTIGTGGSNSLATRLKPFTNAALGTTMGAGLRFAPIGDVNGDGRSDLLVGAATGNEILIVSATGFPTALKVLARIPGPTADTWANAISVRNASGSAFPAILMANPLVAGGKGQLVGAVVVGSAGGFSLTGDAGARELESARATPADGLQIVTGDRNSLVFSSNPAVATITSSGTPDTTVTGTAPHFGIVAGVSTTIGEWLTAVRGALTIDAFVRILPGFTASGAPDAAGESPEFGTVVTSLGDAFDNGTNCPEFAASAPQAGNGGRGLVRVFSCTGSVVFEGTGSNPGDGYGTAIASLPSMHGDSRGELAIGVPGDASGAGRVEVRTLGAAINGQTVRSIPAPSGAVGFGTSLSVDGNVDLNNDGCFDLIVGAPASDGGKGRVYAVCADVRHAAFGSVAWAVSGAGTEQGIGRTVHILGDVDATPGVEIAIGRDSCGSGLVGGFSLVHADGSGLGGLFPPSCPATSTGEGAAFTRLADIDGAAGDEFAVAAPGASSGRGEVAIYGLTGNAVVVKRRIAAPDGVSSFGQALSPASGKVIALGSEFLVGADVPTGAGGGAVFVADAASAHFARRLLHHNALAGDGLGSAVALVPDTNGDQLLEVVAGAPGIAGAGRVLFAKSTPRPTFAGVPLFASLGAVTKTTASIVFNLGSPGAGVEVALRRTGRAWAAPTFGSMSLTNTFFTSTINLTRLEPGSEYLIRLRGHETGKTPGPWSAETRFTTLP